MSDTPRTDSALQRLPSGSSVVDICRQFERENAVMEKALRFAKGHYHATKFRRNVIIEALAAVEKIRSGK